MYVKKEFLNKLDSIGGNWFIILYACKFAKHPPILNYKQQGTVRNVLSDGSTADKKLCYGRRTARRACQYRKKLAVNK